MNIVGSHVFAWDDGTLVDYTRWMADQPDFQPNTEQQCALMDLVEWRGHWEDSKCTTVDYKRAVCKTPQGIFLLL